jgi:hypothetical protein
MDMALVLIPATAAFMGRGFPASRALYSFRRAMGSLRLFHFRIGAKMLPALHTGVVFIGSLHDLIPFLEIETHWILIKQNTDAL